MYFSSYKQASKMNEIIARFSILKERLYLKAKVKTIVEKYNIHRNSVRNLVNLFKQKAPDGALELLSKSLTSQEIISNFPFLAYESRAPLSNKNSANKEATDFVLQVFKQKNRGVPRMFTHISRQSLLKQYNLTLGKIKGIYKKNNLKLHTVKIASGRSKPLYNYDQLEPFERIHIDTKHILDLKGLTQDIYDKFNLQKDLPIYQRTVIDAKSRFRFLFYSHQINSTMGLNVLLFTIMYLRHCGINCHITVGTDGGAEFFSASETKKAERNKYLALLNAEIYCYEGNKDVRKNLIERSHRTDDEEFYCPRGIFINDEQEFKKEALNWYLYYNFQRPIGGKYMKGRTPIEVISQSKVIKAKYLLDFPLLILDKCLGDLLYHTSTIRLAYQLSKAPELSTKKDQIDFMYKHNFFNNHFAQNVLAIYQIY